MDSDGLAFSLLIHDRSALLCLDHRQLDHGITLRDYQAEITNITFPFEGPQTPSDYQHRRCHAKRLTLVVELGRLMATLSARLRGHRCAGLDIETIAIDFDPKTPSLLLRVDGWDSDNQWGCLIYTLDVYLAGRTIAFVPRGRWNLSDAHIEPLSVWWAMGAALQPMFATPSTPGLAHAHVLDPVRTPLRRAFVSKGWKAPDISALSRVTLATNDKGLELQFDDEDATSSNAEPIPWLRSATIDVSALEAFRTNPPAIDHAEAVIDAFRAKLVATAVWRWLVHRCRANISPESLTTRITALERWLALDPNDRLAQRWRVEASLARRLNDHPLPSPPDSSDFDVWSDDDDPRTTAARLLEQAKTSQHPSLIRRALKAAINARTGPELTQVIDLATSHAVPMTRAWATAYELAIQEHDPAFVIHLLDVARSCHHEPSLRDSVPAQLDRAVASLPTAPHLLDQLWQTLADREDRAVAALDRIAGLSDAHELDALTRAHLMLDISNRFEPQKVSALLSAYSRAELARPSDETTVKAQRAWIDGLVARGLTSTAVDVITWVASHHASASVQQMAIGQLIRLHRDVLHNESETTRWIQHGLERSPTNPQLIAVMLDECFAPDDIHQTIAVIDKLLSRASLGTTAYLVLLQRALDATLALGEIEAARAMLQRARARHPEEPTLATREQDLKTAAREPLAMIELLTHIAHRQSGAIRREALATRAHHRIELGHPEAALVDLQTILSEDSKHNRALAQLWQLCERTERWREYAAILERLIAPVMNGGTSPNAQHIEQLELLARVYRDFLGAEDDAVRIYKVLAQAGRIPDDGLSTLARVYHREQQYDDLVHILLRHREVLTDAPRRRAAVDARIGELLDQSLGRPRDAVQYYLDAYLIDPYAYASAGARARVLFSGIDSIDRVRRRLLNRLPRLDGPQKTALLVLLGDILANHGRFESDAEQCYRQALDLVLDHPLAETALGRFLLRQDRRREAVTLLLHAVMRPDAQPSLIVENASLVAAALTDLARPLEAESALRRALTIRPQTPKLMLQLATLHSGLGQKREQAAILGELLALPDLPLALEAEAAYLMASIYMAAARSDPFCPQAERARAYLQQAAAADGRHAAARQALLELATARLEWAVVAQMHYLRIREQPSGKPRGLAHLDLAQTYLEHLGDFESAARNLESALSQAPNEPEILRRIGSIAAQLPDAARAAERFEALAMSPGDLATAVRAYARLLAADLRATTDDPDSVETNARAVLELGQPEAAVRAAQRHLDALARDDARDLRQQKSGLLKLLQTEENAIEQLHILDRLRELGVALEDTDLVEWATERQFELADTGIAAEEFLHASSSALTNIYAERGSYEDMLLLQQQLAEHIADPAKRAEVLVSAAQTALAPLKDISLAIGLVRQALDANPGHAGCQQLLIDIVRHPNDASSRGRVYEEVSQIEPRFRDAKVELELARLARSMGRTNEAMSLLRPLTLSPYESSVRLEALRELDGILATDGAPVDRIPVLRRYFSEAQSQQPEYLCDIAYELARTEQGLGHHERALEVIQSGLNFDPDDRNLLLLQLDVLERLGRWRELADALEQLASRTVGVEQQTAYLVRAARVHLQPHDGTDPAEAHRLLVRASELSPNALTPRCERIRLAFSDERWDEVLALAVNLEPTSDAAESALILASFAEAMLHGQQSFARSLGSRATATEPLRFGLAQLLTTIADQGPLPRLDPVLSVAAILVGGRKALHTVLQRFAKGPLRPGLYLGLARLAEADGDADRSRFYYQLAAFSAPYGPTPKLLPRLPLPRFETPFNILKTANTYGCRSICQCLRELPPPPPDKLSIVHEDDTNRRLVLVNTVLDPWRTVLDLPLPAVWTEARHPGGLSVERRPKPTLLVGPGVARHGVPELRFRLALLVVETMLGLTDINAHVVPDLLASLAHSLDPDRYPSPGESPWLELFKRSAIINPPALQSELDYWLSETKTSLPTTLRRIRLLLATQLSGQIDGALRYLAQRHGTMWDQEHVDPHATAALDDAQWLMCTLKLVRASGGRGRRSSQPPSPRAALST